MSTRDETYTSRRRVCHLTTAHSRNDTRIWLKECRSLASAGYEVHLIVSDGQGDAITDNVAIHDIGARPGSRFKRMWAQPSKAERTALKLRPDIVHFHDPELLPAGVRLARRGIRVIYDVHEDVPRQIQTMEWLPRILRAPTAAIFEVYENRAVTHFTGMVAATPYIKRRFKDRGLSTIGAYNYPLLEELVPAKGEVNREARVCYIGAIARVRGLVQVIRALPMVPGVRLTLCGAFGEPDLETELRSEPGWAQVDYMGTVDREALRRVMGRSRAGLVTFLSAPNHVQAQPNKLFEYMSAELPVIASHFPSWQAIVGGAGCGLCVDPESPSAIAGAIRAIIDSPRDADRMGRAGRQAVVHRYNWPVEAQKLLHFYRA